MRKVLLMLLMLCAVAGASAQNANRSGIFVEAAVGGSVGNPPLGGLSFDGSKLLAHYCGGAAFNLAFGYRLRTGNHTAFDVRVSAQANTDGLAKGQSFVLKAMPGFRVTTGEIFRNYSLFFGANLGAAMANDGHPQGNIPINGEVLHWSPFGEVMTVWGISYEISFGVNITTHLYAGAVWSAQYMFSQYRDFTSPSSTNSLYMEELQNLHYGMVGFRLGYRF